MVVWENEGQRQFRGRSTGSLVHCHLRLERWYFVQSSLARCCYRDSLPDRSGPKRRGGKISVTPTPLHYIKVEVSSENKNLRSGCT